MRPYSAFFALTFSTFCLQGTAISQLVVWFNELSEKFRAYESGELKLDL